MSLQELNTRIRLVLDNESSAIDLPGTLDLVNAFVQEQQDAPEAGIMDQLRDDLESMYRELVDHTSSTNLETFVSILCAFRPIFRPIHVITYWWDLVLRAALRDPRLSTKSLDQVKELTLHGLVADSDKGAEFQKRIIELYLLDAYDESSGQEELDRATMSTDERKIQQFWKQNLGEILEDFSMKRPEEFLTSINSFFQSPEWRLRLSVLLGAVVRSPDFSAKLFAEHPILDSLLMSLVVDGSSTLFELEIMALATLLPQLAVHAPETLRRILPMCFAVLARVVCWRPRPNAASARYEEKPDSSPQTYPTELEIDTALTPPLRPDLDWKKLESTFMSAIDPPSALPLFRCVYGLYPCNTLGFLRDPVLSLNRLELKSPFAEDWAEVLDEGQIRTRSRVLFRQNILHSSLLMQTIDMELADPNRWPDWDVSRITMMCTMLDVRHAALSLRRMPDDFQIPDPTHPTANQLSSTQNQFSATDTPADHPEIQDIRATDLSNPGRPRVSVQDILATYHTLKSGVEIDIIDETPVWPQLLFPMEIPSPAGTEDTMSTLKASPTEPDSAMPRHVEDAIAGLQRENLLLRNELNYELWLKRENVKRIGRLYQDRISVKGAEMERQGLHNKLREYKGQVHRLQTALAKEQAGAATTKSQHTDYSNRLHARLKTEREEKRSWADEKSKLKSAYDDVKAMLDAQAVRLADASSRVFLLQTQIKEYEPKVERLADYEEKIEQFTKTQQLWDEDVRRYKEQEVYLDDLRSRYRKKLLLIESFENANRTLEDTIISLKNRVSALESQKPQPRLPEPSPNTFQMMEVLRGQVSALTLERDALQSKVDEQGDLIEDLNVRLELQQGREHEAVDEAADEAADEL